MRRSDFEIDFDISGSAGADVRYEFKMPSGKSVFMYESNYLRVYDLINLLSEIGDEYTLDDVVVVKSPNRIRDAGVAVSDIINSIPGARKKIKTSKSHVHTRLRRMLRGHGFIP